LRCALAPAAALAFLAGCTVGPNYTRPGVAVPAAYKEAAKARGWSPAEPADAAKRGAWWSIYGDPVLDGLERRIDISNQNLKASEASYREAEAIVAQARAGFFPTVAIDGSASRSRASGSGSSRGSFGGGSGGFLSNSFGTSADASWTPDLWGRIRRIVEGDVASAQASAGDLASARLSAQGSLATDYLELRVADELKRLLDSAVKAYAQSLAITRNQYASGVAAQSDVAQAEAQLAATQAQEIAVGVTRAQLEHAIAVLVGVPPAALSIAPTLVVTTVPAIPAGVPSALLQRRPDIATNERLVAAANADIGVAVAAFYPDITLSADYGVSSAAVGTLFEAASRMWSIGGDLTQTVFDAGARQAVVQQARAEYDAAVANYRQAVLSAFQQVEDELAALRILAQQAVAEERAVAAARSAEQVIENQYKAGTVAYTSVVVAETTALTDEESALNIRESRLTASAALIQALGGGWNAAQLPSRARIEADSPLDFDPLPP
jgi:NodT family efflux transporter outer membrane factor (OMF) lipoprotein